ncbi:hypothetical protein [Methylorubrum extorquens]|jgi:hypothetical protein|uniref:hypothetical protein n=1 Tax=Methylorubrum extorquens TaxID=408 RepID=UPI0022370282|nr:hypothetical protein [Methylorubrum extorquens]UYW28936.1 hypothetical protein OKC48_10610 [Methylorubrum extorquens]UYW31347.1 hypothetical protein OKB92_20575 [Methylorubrum extorquens]
MRPVRTLGLAALIAVAAGSLAPAQAQYYDDGYDAPPPRARAYRDRDWGGPPPRRAMGLNCDAVQSGISGLQPFSCPLPGPRPLGARCFCNMPVSFLNGPRTAVGRVAP